MGKIKVFLFSAHTMIHLSQFTTTEVLAYHVRQREAEAMQQMKIERIP